MNHSLGKTLKTSKSWSIFWQERKHNTWNGEKIYTKVLTKHTYLQNIPTLNWKYFSISFFSAIFSWLNWIKSEWRRFTSFWFYFWNVSWLRYKFSKRYWPRELVEVTGLELLNVLSKATMKKNRGESICEKHDFW